MPESAGLRPLPEPPHPKVMDHHGHRERAVDNEHVSEELVPVGAPKIRN